MSVPPVGAPRKGGTILKKLAKVIFWLAVIWLIGIIGHDDMCAEMNYEVAECQ